MVLLTFDNQLAYEDRYLKNGRGEGKRLSAFMLRWIQRHRPDVRRFMYFPNDWNLAATGEVWEIPDVKLRVLFKLTFHA
jgi:hypothetical protein